jgi:predicted dehydrogenase
MNIKSISISPSNSVQKSTVRLGILSTAGITRGAIINPSKHLNSIKVCAIASRKPLRAMVFAKRNKIPTYYGNYEELLEDPNIDAIYNPLPNSLHMKWSIKALRAGKHVLCEKPFASNEEEAHKMKKVAEETGKLLIEAFHIRYHPLLNTIKKFLDDGAIGPIQDIYAKFCINLNPKKYNIRLDGDLAGGGVMDVGCYCISLLRMLGGSEPSVVSAHAKTEYKDSRIDTYLHGDLQFPNEIKASLDCSLITNNGGSKLLVKGTKGTLVCNNPFSSTGSDFIIDLNDGTSKTTKVKTRSHETTYYYQLESFANHIISQDYKTNPPITDVDDAIGNMRVIDALYTKAGLTPRMKYE